MTETMFPEDNPGPNMRTITHVIYGLFLVGLIGAAFFGLAVVAAIVLVYFKRSDAVGTLYAGHFDWVIKTFWWGLLWMVLSAVTTHIYIGWIGGLVAVVWLLYRLIKGWLALFAGQTPEADT